MKEQLNRIAARIDALSLRERGILFFGVLLVMYMAWDALLMGPLDARKEQATRRITALQQEVATIDAQIAEVIARRQNDPNVELRRQIEQLKHRHGELDARIGEAMSGLVEPQEMARVIEAVLQHHSGLRPLRVESLGSTPLVEQAAPGAVMLYRHRMQIELQGTYPATVQFLRALQELPWAFYWDAVVVEMEDYPRARVVVTVSTLSLKEGWIGV